LAVEGLVRGPPSGLFVASPAADVFGDGVALGDDGFGLFGGDWGVVNIEDRVSPQTVETSTMRRCHVRDT
jgi:hypothetical protein